MQHHCHVLFYVYLSAWELRSAFSHPQDHLAAVSGKLASPLPPLPLCSIVAHLPFVSQHRSCTQPPLVHKTSLSRCPGACLTVNPPPCSVLLHRNSFALPGFSVLSIPRKAGVDVKRALDWHPLSLLSLLLLCASLWSSLWRTPPHLASPHPCSDCTLHQGRQRPCSVSPQQFSLGLRDHLTPL